MIDLNDDQGELSPEEYDAICDELEALQAFMSERIDASGGNADMVVSALLSVAAQINEQLSPRLN